MSARGSQTGSETARRNSQSGSETSRSRAQSNKGSACSSPRSRQGSQHISPTRSRHNKIYHTPPTPPPEIQLEKEKSFVLDSMAVSSISKDYSKTNPKLGPVIPPYNACNDKDVREYFKFIGVKNTVDRSMSKPRNQKKDKSDEPEQYWPYTSIDGKVQDHFNSEGAGHRYLGKRNQFGAGHSRELTDGHAQFMQGVKPITGYNGSYGYRRTSPWLRMKPSPFGTASTSPCYDPSVIEHIRERNEAKQTV